MFLSDSLTVQICCVQGSDGLDVDSVDSMEGIGYGRFVRDYGVGETVGYYFDGHAPFYSLSAGDFGTFDSNAICWHNDSFPRPGLLRAD